MSNDKELTIQPLGQPISDSGPMVPGSKMALLLSETKSE